MALLIEINIYLYLKIYAVWPSVLTAG